MEFLLGPTENPGSKVTDHTDPFRSFWVIITAIGILLPFVLWGYYDNRGGTEGKAAFLVFLSALISSVACLLGLLAGRAFVVVQRNPTRRRIGFVATISGVVAIWLITYALSLHLIGLLLPRVQNVSDSLSNDSWQTISNEFSASHDSTLKLSFALGAHAGGKDSEAQFVNRIQEPLQQATRSQGRRSARQLAEREFLSSIVTLWTKGPLYPQYDASSDIVNRLTVLIEVYRTLSNAGRTVEGEQAYVTLLHGRFMVALTAFTIASHSNARVNETLKSVANDCFAGLLADLKQSRHRDGLLTLDHIGAECLLTGQWQDGYSECSRALAQLPHTDLCSAESLSLRFHILRLKFFVLLCNAALDADSNSKEPFRIAFANHQPELGSAIDTSLGYVRTFHSQNHSFEEMAPFWIDTLLVLFIKLGSRFHDECAWDRNLLRSMILEQTTQSQKLLAKLGEIHELSPDFIEPSLNLHFEAIRLWDRENDENGFRRLVEHGLKYSALLLSGTGVLYTPLRSPDPSGADVSEIEAKHRYFRELSEGLSDHLKMRSVSQ